VVVHRPQFAFKNSRRLFDTLQTIRFLRRTIKSIEPDTVLSFGEIWNNMVLLSLRGLSYPVYVSDRSQPEKDLGRLQNFLRRKLYPTATGYVAQTVAAKKVCEERGWNSNICVIGNPMRRIKPDSSVVKENIVLTVGRLIETKHIDQLIEMFLEIDKPGWRLCIVGGDAKKKNLSNELRNLVEKHNGGTKVFLEGQQRDVDQYYNRSKIFAFTSSSEGFPNVIGEALSAGLPVVAYDCMAGPADMIEDGKNGFLVPLFNQQEFARNLKQLMSDNALREEMGAYAKHSISRFDSKTLMEEYFKFILNYR
jgi:glycosyltransferase involved in cell wall biosynthesis